MKRLSCSAALRRLHSFLDGELPVQDQIAVGTHLDRCESCRTLFEELRHIGSVLRASGPGRDGMSEDEMLALSADVASRRKAERDGTWLACLRRVFDDRHLVYAGVGAAAATVLCVAIMLSMMRFATAGRPDSLAALVDLMASPAASPNSIAIDAASHERGTARFQAAYESAEEDAVFALSAIVTRHSRLDLRRWRAADDPSMRNEAKLVKALMDSVTRARIQPGTIAAAASAKGMVWLVTRTTVRATRIGGMDLPLPPAGKKRMTRADSPAGQRRAGLLT